MCSQDSIYDCIPDLIVDDLVLRTADEELVLRAEKRQMVTQYEARAKADRKLAKSIHETLIRHQIRQKSEINVF